MLDDKMVHVTCDYHENDTSIQSTDSERASPINYHHTNTSTQPVDIRSDKGHEGGKIPKSMSLPLNQLTPNPFPELQGSPVSLSASTLSAGELCKSSPTSPLIRKRDSYPRRQSNPVTPSNRVSTPDYEDDCSWRPQSYTKMMLNVYIDEQNYKTLSIDGAVTASDLCHMLVLKMHASEDKSWSVVEYLAKFSLERSLEDHEHILSVYNNWSNTIDNRFYFRKDFRKYAMYNNPTQFFPLQMMNIRESSCWDLLDKVERHKNVLLKNLFSAGEQLPEINSFLHFRDGKKWKKAYFVLRQSGLYYSSKGLSKDPRHLVLYADISDYHIYLAINARKTFSSHTQYCFCLKPYDRIGDDIKDFKILCADDEQSRMCWISGLRLIKHGSQITNNYKAAIKRLDKLRNPDSSHHSEDDLYVKSRVAMDFTGMKGRVIDDPAEAIGVAIEEGLSWRKRVVATTHMVRSQSPTTAAGPSPVYVVSSVPMMQIHLAQPWFHGDIQREEAIQLITTHGLVDGVFLVRNSRKVPGTFVLSLAHNQKVKHCQIIKVVDDGMLCYSLDGGYTKFTDLLQLVEFYQVNPGGLPTRLKHYVGRLM